MLLYQRSEVGPLLTGVGMSQTQNFFGELVRIQTELWNTVDSRLKDEFDLPVSRFEPMQVIARRGACRVFDIASELGISVGGASKIIDRIEAAGYCIRRDNPDDRRSSLIELTASGRRILAKASAAFDEELSRLLAPVAPRTIDQLVSGLLEVRVGIAQHASHAETA